MDLLIFELDEQRCSLPATEVLEVLRAAAIEPLPGALAHVEGLLDVRGALLPVFDLRTRLGLPPRALEPSDYLVLAVAGSRTVALRVARLPELVRASAGDVEALHSLVSDAAPAVAAVKLPDGVVLIQDLGRFLSESEAQVLDAQILDASLTRAQPDDP